MIWTYMFTKSKLDARDVASLSELQEQRRETDWLWIDCVSPDKEELEIVAETLGDAKIVDAIAKQQTFSRYEKVNDYLRVSIPFVAFKNGFETHPLYVFIQDGIFITVRDTETSETVSDVLKILQDCRSKVEQGTISSFIVSRLLHEAADKNLNTIMVLRDRIDKIEEKALEKPTDTRTGKTVFSLKRDLSALERILWVQRGLMLSLKEDVVPTIQLSEVDERTLSYAINNISRELSLISSHNNTLDSILRLQDLGMIHRVERILIYLTLVTLLVNTILILFEIGVLKVA